MRGADQDRSSRDAGALLDGRADLLDGLAADAQRVDADDRDAVAAIVEDRGPDLAGVMHLAVVRLAVAAGCLHADRRRDVALGETGLEGRPGLRLCLGCPGREQQQDRESPQARSTRHGVLRRLAHFLAALDELEPVGDRTCLTLSLADHLGLERVERLECAGKARVIRSLQRDLKRAPAVEVDIVVAKSQSCTTLAWRNIGVSSSARFTPFLSWASVSSATSLPSITRR